MPVGGAWEVVVDKAALEVAKYLAQTAAPFVADAAEGRWMLALLDRGALRDVVVERSLNGLCGMVGCAEAMQQRQEEGDDDDDRDRASDGGAVESDDEDVAEAFRQCDKYRRRHVVPGAALGDRFCSPACAAQFAALLEAVQPSLVCERAELPAAIGGLFPNMRLDVLQRLAGAESTAVADIQERDPHAQSHEQPQQQHVSVGEGADAVATQVREVLQGIVPLENVLEPATRTDLLVGSNKRREQRTPMPLAVYDWLLTISTPRTKNLFAKLCYRSFGGGGNGELHDGDASSGEESGFYAQCMLPIRALCLQRGRRQQEGAEVVDEDDPTVDPLLQQQRLALFASYAFSAETTGMLSRLLLYDYATLEEAWDVWRSDGLLESLQFPFALPGFVTGGGTTPPGIFLALVLAAATGLSMPAAWEEWLRDNGAAVELLAALGATTDDLVACVRALVLE
ncbi:hypothetical protein DQ04_05021010 [Trypanosoma grayi]|uniref:hypothetical protein n=1 Tax=Trypanosoma grayi TaxID=71804 RepID=UPI0004F41C84|nr:hypothetical protein DQ04_05021010 [Trypanosoma grayi]KEG09562.1 hypothetical protein DQ04_05021010 [Trypanosoma grayi]